MRSIEAAAIALSLLAAAPAVAQENLEGCKDHPLFSSFPSMYIVGCKTIEFDARKFPLGPPDKDGQITGGMEVEGATYWLRYEMKDGATPASPLQISRNFENAVKKAGGTIEARYPGWCKANYDAEKMPDMGNSCTSDALVMKFVRGGKETWAFLQAEEGAFAMTISEREAMKQEVSVNEMADALTKEGFLTLSVNFDTGKATITPDSAATLDAAAGALQAASTIRVEVGGHTDNVGAPEANLRLSQDRAQAVMAALVARGVKADRLTAKGYGQTAPVADNRTEEGRAKNRRVELVKK